MKTILLILMLCATVFAQKIYEVQPGTEGNQISLSIDNVSSSHTSEDLWVREVGQSQYLSFVEKEVMIEVIDKSSSKTADFKFDIDKNAPANQLDTLRFLMTDNNSNKWEKEIVLKYLAPTEYILEQNYPNPFNPSTVISFQLPVNSLVNLKIYNALGQEVITLVSKDLTAGYHELEWNAFNFASGMYIYQLIATPTNGSSRIMRKKMMLIK